VGKVEYDPASEASAGDACSRTASMDRKAILACVLNYGDDIARISRANHAHWFDFEDARITGIHLDKDVVAPDFTFDQTT
jgi:hypothetical protein